MIVLSNVRVKVSVFESDMRCHTVDDLAAEGGIQNLMAETDAKRWAPSVTS
ncbi:hypothetical protein GCM10008994_15060 [Halorubrum ejinorense]|uniref:Uncharacterized protein n=1 Tax=Halorubrum ejinorense TaxID=425309 RepID=A0AAV3SSN5_9EURY